MTFGPHVAPTPPSSDNSDRIATTAFIPNLFSNWQSYTPVYGAQLNSSAIAQSVVAGTFLKVGTTVFMIASVTSTSTGIGSSMGFATISAPTAIFTPVAFPSLYGRDNSGGKGLIGVGAEFGSSLFAVTYYDATSPVGTNNLIVQATYQSSS